MNMHMHTQILRLGHCGTPMQWLTPMAAALLLCKRQVVWSLGENAVILRGGHNNQGQRSELSVPAIIATRGAVNLDSYSPTLINRMLFRRDGHICLYCGQHFSSSGLSRDHVFPRARGGQDVWENVVTACKRCNHRKGCRTPEEAGMPLLAIPYRPNVFEYAVLSNHRILTDQMAFLQGGFSPSFQLPSH